MAKQSSSKKPLSTVKNLITSGITTAGHVTRDNLERVGDLLDSINGKPDNATHFTAVDLSDFGRNNTDNLFSQQTLKATQELMGSRFARYGKVAKKVIPDSAFNSAADSAFAQVAKLAEKWSQIDLPDEHRFEEIKDLDDQERSALAHKIANQNRALATMGGVTGLAGLPGVLADTLWLMLVSLRTVYQLAEVHNQPLQGKRGIKLAYAVLSKSDLSKMQEKQALLSGLGVAKELLDKADNRGLTKELANSGVLNANVEQYAEQIDTLAQKINIDIDNINLSWLTRFLPVTSVALGAYYNSRLIEQVIGTAKATFAPEPKMAITSSKKNQDKPATDKRLEDDSKDDDVTTVKDETKAESDKNESDNNNDDAASTNSDTKSESTSKDEDDK